MVLFTSAAASTSFIVFGCRLAATYHMQERERDREREREREREKKKKKRDKKRET